MAGTGVGGIKDSQGNYVILGKGDSQIGTRSGTLKTTVGDVAGQTTGRMYTAIQFEQTPKPTNIWTLSLQGFSASSPVTLPNELVLLQGGSDSFIINVTPQAGGDDTGFRVDLRFVGQASTLSSNLFGAAVILGDPTGTDDTIFVPNTIVLNAGPRSTVATATLTYSFSKTNGQEDQFPFPFSCKIIDAWIIGVDVADAVELRRCVNGIPAALAFTTLNGAGADSLVRATTMTADTFAGSSGVPTLNNELNVRFTGAGPITGRLCITIVRAGAL